MWSYLGIQQNTVEFPAEWIEVVEENFRLLVSFRRRTGLGLEQFWISCIPFRTIAQEISYFELAFAVSQLQSDIGIVRAPRPWPIVSLIAAEGNAQKLASVSTANQSSRGNRNILERSDGQRPRIAFEGSSLQLPFVSSIFGIRYFFPRQLFFKFPLSIRCEIRSRHVGNFYLKSWRLIY